MGEAEIAGQHGFGGGRRVIDDYHCIMMAGMQDAHDDRCLIDDMSESLVCFALSK